MTLTNGEGGGVLLSNPAGVSLSRRPPLLLFTTPYQACNRWSVTATPSVQGSVFNFCLKLNPPVSSRLNLPFPLLSLQSNTSTTGSQTGPARARAIAASALTTRWTHWWGRQASASA